LISSN